MTREPDLVPTHDDIVYAAGLFDGEGCVGIYRYTNNGYPSRRIVVTLNQRAPAVIEWLAQRWAGTTNERANTNGNPIHHWNVVTIRAKKFLTDIQPYVIVKKAQVDYVLRAPHPPAEYDELEMKRLKRVYDLCQDEVSLVGLSDAHTSGHRSW